MNNYSVPIATPFDGGQLALRPLIKIEQVTIMFPLLFYSIRIQEALRLFETFVEKVNDHIIYVVVPTAVPFDWGSGGTAADRDVRGESG